MKPLLSFLAGLAAGALLVALWQAVPLRQQAANQYVLGAVDQAFIGLCLTEGRTDSLRETIEQTLPEYARTVHTRYLASPLANDALWLIRRYYERNGLQIPAQAKPYLAGVPAQPSEETRRRLDALANDSARRAAEE